MDVTVDVNPPLNEITGTPGNDLLTGTPGGDRITGGPGLDQIDISSGGNDEIIYTQLIDTPDIITGFTVGSDAIDLSGILAQIGYGGSDPIGDGYLVFQQSGANTLIQLDVDGTATRGIPRSIILVNGVNASDLGQPSNFILS